MNIMRYIQCFVVIQIGYNRFTGTIGYVVKFKDNLAYIRFQYLHSLECDSCYSSTSELDNANIPWKTVGSWNVYSTRGILKLSKLMYIWAAACKTTPRRVCCYRTGVAPYFVSVRHIQHKKSRYHSTLDV